MSQLSNVAAAAAVAASSDLMELTPKQLFVKNMLAAMGVAHGKFLVSAAAGVAMSAFADRLSGFPAFLYFSHDDNLFFSSRYF